MTATTISARRPARTERSGRLLSGVGADATIDLARHVEIWGALPSLPAVEILDAVERSGLLGRGGAGFPTARKLRAVAAGKGRPIVVANGCEGEPASAKDAVLLARAPHLVLDGIQLAVRALGADRAHLVVHQGSPVIPWVRAAIAERRHDPVEVTLETVPARYVASEASAIVSALNGGEALPMFTPSRLAARGVDRRPTMMSNVESLAHLATIARFGPEWFAELGDPAQPGTMLVTVSGVGADRRVAEVATGTTIGRVVKAAGVSLADSEAVLVGGYFGSWIPAKVAERLPLAHHALHDVGATVGAGVIAVLPPGSCGLVETARVASYLAAHSARQCGPCLNGLPAIADAMGALAAGRWDEHTWPALNRWLDVVPGRGACRHPDGAVRFVASALETFADDVAMHRAGRPCAGSATAPFLPVPTKPMWA